MEFDSMVSLYPLLFFATLPLMVFIFYHATLRTRNMWNTKITFGLKLQFQIFLLTKAMAIVHFKQTHFTFD